MSATLWRQFTGKTLTCLALALAVAGPDANAQVAVDCDAYSQADRLTCLQQVATASDARLAQARQGLASAIDRWDEEVKYRAAARRRMEDSDQAFEKYRAMQCALQKALGGGAIGNGLEMRRLMCVAALNQHQAMQLEQLMQSITLR